MAEHYYDSPRCSVKTYQSKNIKYLLCVLGKSLELAMLPSSDLALLIVDTTFLAHSFPRTVYQILS